MVDIEKRAKSIEAAVEREYAEWLKTKLLPEGVTINEYQFTLSRNGSLGMCSRNTVSMRAIAEASVPRGWSYDVLETVGGEPVFALGQYYD